MRAHPSGLTEPRFEPVMQSMTPSSGPAPLVLLGWLTWLGAFPASGASPLERLPREGFVQVTGGPAWYRIVGSESTGTCGARTSFAPRAPCVTST